MDSQLIVSKRSGSVAWLRMNRPDAMNALNAELLDGLNAAIDSVETDGAIRIVVLTGTGKAFCAGAELKGVVADDGTIDTEQVRKFVTYAASTIERVAMLDKPVIAAVNGFTLAGGMELMMACDLVIAAETARIGDAHSNYGLLPGAGGAARLTRIAGPLFAKYLAFTGDHLPASTLVQYGLVNEAVRDEELVPRVERLAQQLAAKSLDGLASMKRLINTALDEPLTKVLSLEQDALVSHAQSDDFREGLTAFSEKRPPKFVTQGSDMGGRS